jgi:hypothetical protein
MSVQVHAQQGNVTPVFKLLMLSILLGRALAETNNLNTSLPDPDSPKASRDISMKL